MPVISSKNRVVTCVPIYNVCISLNHLAHGNYDMSYYIIMNIIRPSQIRHRIPSRALALKHCLGCTCLVHAVTLCPPPPLAPPPAGHRRWHLAVPRKCAGPVVTSGWFTWGRASLVAASCGQPPPPLIGRAGWPPVARARCDWSARPAEEQSAAAARWGRTRARPLLIRS